MAVSTDLVGKAADFVGAFADSLGREFGQDQKQEAAELLAKIAAAALRKILGVDGRLVAGTSADAADFEAAIEDAVDLAKSVP